MADVFSLYQIERTEEPLNPPAGQWKGVTDKWGGAFPSALLHTNLQGLVPKDITYLTNRFALVGSGSDNPVRQAFKIDTFPDNFTAITLKYRTRTNTSTGCRSGWRIRLWQGKPMDGTVLFDWDINDAWTDGLIPNTWLDSIKVITPSLVTDPSDVWILLQTDGAVDEGFEGCVPVFRNDISWLVLDVKSPYQPGETPTSKNYVSSLAKILNVSIRTVGTAGTSRYCYRVIPCNSSGVCGPPSDEIVIETGNASLDATDHICLSWLDVADVTNYKIYRTCAPSGLGLGLLATVLPDLGDCGTGGGGTGDTGYKDIGVDCVTDCDETFNPEDFEGCEDETTVTIGAKETPTTVTFPSKETPV